MANSERSSFIFQLADKFQLPYGAKSSAPIEDSQFIEFCREYLTQAEKREFALSQYLTTHNTYFRNLIPFSSNAFEVAAKTIWYYDEAIIRDPLGANIQPLEQGDLEAKKQNVVQVLNVLNLFRSAIDSGYLLLAGSSVLPNLDSTGMSKIVSPSIDFIAKDPHVQRALEEAARYGFEIRKNPDGLDWMMFQIGVDSVFTFGWKTKDPLPAGENASPAWKVGEDLITSTKNTLINALGPDIDVQQTLESLYPTEILNTVNLLTTADMLNAPVLFYRNHHAVIANTTGQAGGERQAVNTGGLNLALPYFEKIDHARLADLREKMPGAFLEFRNSMSEIVKDALQEDPASANSFLADRAKQKIVPNLEKLKIEAEESAKRSRLHAYSGAGIASVATLVGAAAGAGVVPLLAINATAIGNCIRTYTEHRKVINEDLHRSPLYFLWKANQ